MVNKVENFPWFGKYWPDYVEKNIDYPEIPLYKILDDSANKYPNHTYLIFFNRAFSFSQVNNMANQFANALKSLRAQKGDRVALYMPNVPYFPIAFFGALKAGATVVAANPLYTAPELEYQMNDSGAKILIVLDHPNFYQKAAKIQKNTNIEQIIYANLKDVLPKTKALIGGLLGKIPKAKEKNPQHIDFFKLIKNQPTTIQEPQINPKEDVAVILYTGGTTGFPKGAMLTHYNLIANLYAMQAWVWPPADPGKNTIMGVLPFFHSFGLSTCMLFAALTGIRLVLLPDPRAGNPPFTEILKAITKYRATYFHAVPTLYTAILNHPQIDKFDLSSLKACLSGAAPLPIELMKQFEEKTGARIVEGYGMTETSPVLTANPMKGERRPGSVGLPFPNTIIKIVDVEDPNKELPLGEVGEIAAKGPQVMKGYWNKPEENQKVFNDKGYLLTGDIGYMDEDGFLYITDRKKDMIIASGYKIFPREVEEVLYAHPKVQLATVVGVPDPKRGETAKAYIVPKKGETLTEEEIIKFCKERLAPYKVPKLVEFRDELPTSAVGKVLRRVLRDEERKKLQTTSQ